jgi:ribosomal protein L11 methyltransferase
VVTEHDDSEWQDKWKEYFKPFRVSEHILIKPSWEEVEADPEDHVLEIDPGMAFGTGTHETTSMCIEMMEDHLQPGDRVLDAGCGSGILSIAAVLLGAGDVLGVDIDEDAVRVAQENIQLNHVEAKARAEYGDVTEGVDYQADLVAANLMAELLCMVTPGIYRHLSPGGIYISSGILLEKEEMVTDAITMAGFQLCEVRRKGEWCCIAARRPEDERSRRLGDVQQ